MPRIITPVNSRDAPNGSNQDLCIPEITGHLRPYRGPPAILNNFPKSIRFGMCSVRQKRQTSRASNIRSQNPHWTKEQPHPMALSILILRGKLAAIRSPIDDELAKGFIRRPIPLVEPQSFLFEKKERACFGSVSISEPQSNIHEGSLPLPTNLRYWMHP